MRTCVRDQPGLRADALPSRSLGPEPGRAASRQGHLYGRGALAAAKTIGEAGTSEALTVGDVAFYLGMAMLYAYFGAIPALMLTLLASAILSRGNDAGSSDQTLTVVFGLSLAAVVFAFFAGVAAINEPGDLDDFGQWFVRLVGIAGVFGAAWYLTRPKPGEPQDAEAA